MGHTAIVTYLLENGAETETATMRGETALHLAARANQIEVMRILIRARANVDAKAKVSSLFIVCISCLYLVLEMANNFSLYSICHNMTNNVSSYRMDCMCNRLSGKFGNLRNFSISSCGISVFFLLMMKSMQESQLINICRHSFRGGGNFLGG